MATYLINRLPTSPFGVSPLEKLYYQTLDFSLLKVFGCAYFPYLRPFNQHKLDFRSKRCIFLGPSNLHYGYKYLDLTPGKIFISRRVIFDENSFPFANKHSSHTPSPNSQSETASLPFPIRLNSNPTPSSLSSASLGTMSLNDTTSPNSPSLPIESSPSYNTPRASSFINRSPTA